MSLRRDLEERVQGFASDGVDIIFVSDRYIMDQLMKLRIKSSKPIQVVQVNHMGDIKALSEVAMRELGWVRVEKAAKHGHQIKEHESGTNPSS